jgi:hypothetical protein
MIEKLALNEFVLKPAGTVADGAAVDGEADDGDADDVVGELVVAVVLFELLLHAAMSPAIPTTPMLTSNRRDRR